ncbi:hypothetical protein ASE21_01815 [Flavobacterium sp. Root901]|uniref:hypothetical protein n=1 Tax=Flavobacterium sp. Root901 TaxID=1736605 RepID=UPI000710A26C|nr:hypothetical protein [Flavobacterium sp. Root901]KRD12667.1 hypothetical protein ASE21_01815 [Flavobacterium sp. Root901]
METDFYLAAGWRRTKYPGWWNRFWRSPPPPPDPGHWWAIALIVIGLTAGAAGGLFFRNAIAENHFFAGQNTISSGLFAFGTANVVTGIASALKG